MLSFLQVLQGLCVDAPETNQQTSVKFHSFDMIWASKIGDAPVENPSLTKPLQDLPIEIPAEAKLQVVNSDVPLTRKGSAAPCPDENRWERVSFPVPFEEGM